MYCRSLLLSEGVCRQLGIVTYHPQVNANKPNCNPADEPLLSALSVHIQLVESVRLTPCSSTFVSVKLENGDINGLLLLEQTDDLTNGGYDELEVGESLVHCTDDGFTKVLLCNLTGSTCKVNKGVCLGVASEVNLVGPPTSASSPLPARTENVTADQQRKVTQSVAV